MENSFLAALEAAVSQEESERADVKYSRKKQKHNKQTNKKTLWLQEVDQLEILKENIRRIRADNSSISSSFLFPPLYSHYFIEFWKETENLSKSSTRNKKQSLTCVRSFRSTDISKGLRSPRLLSYQLNPQDIYLNLHKMAQSV